MKKQRILAWPPQPSRKALLPPRFHCVSGLLCPSLRKGNTRCRFNICGKGPSLGREASNYCYRVAPKNVLRLGKQIVNLIRSANSYIMRLASTRILTKAVASLFLYLGIGIPLFVSTEGWSPLDACYFLVVTLTTVGYGNMAPLTVHGKIATIGFILFGLTVVGTMLKNSMEHILNTRQEVVLPQLQKAVMYHDKSVDGKGIRTYLETENRKRVRKGVAKVLGLVTLLYSSGIFWCKQFGQMSFLDAVYFTTVTMSTVGYTDMLHHIPVDSFSKLASILYVGTSVFVTAALIGMGFALWAENFHRRKILYSFDKKLGVQDINRILNSVDVDGSRDLDQAEYIFWRLKELHLLAPEVDIATLMVLKNEFDEIDHLQLGRVDYSNAIVRDTQNKSAIIC